MKEEWGVMFFFGGARDVGEEDDGSRKPGQCCRLLPAAGPGQFSGHAGRDVWKEEGQARTEHASIASHLTDGLMTYLQMQSMYSNTSLCVD